MTYDEIMARNQERYDPALKLVRKPLPLSPDDHQELRQILPQLSVDQLQAIAREQEAAHPVLRQ